MGITCISVRVVRFEGGCRTSLRLFTPSHVRKGNHMKSVWILSGGNAGGVLLEADDVDIEDLAVGCLKETYSRMAPQITVSGSVYDADGFDVKVLHREGAEEFKVKRAEIIRSIQHL